MSDHTRFEIHIYTEGGVVAVVRVRGKRRYLMEKAFLGELIGHPYPAERALREVPDPVGDFYMLSHEQMRAYGKFHRKLGRIERELPARKAQDRLLHGEDTIPPEFQSFCLSLAMGLKYAGSSPQSVVRYAVNVHSREESEAALRFLNRIAAGNYDATELQRLWDRCIADMDLTSQGDPRPFLLSVRAEMAKLIKPTADRRHSRR